MNRKIVAIGSAIIAFALLSSAAYVFFLKPGETTTAPAPQTTTQEAPRAKQPAPSTMTSATKPGVYEVYSDTKFIEAKGKRLLFFHAPWCPQCRQLDADLLKSKLPDNVTIFKVDYDSSTTLRQKYGVTLQTTVVNVDQNGALINKIVAYDQPSYATLQKAFNL